MPRARGGVLGEQPKQPCAEATICVYKCWRVFSWMDGDLGKGGLARAEKTTSELHRHAIIHRINVSSDNISCRAISFTLKRHKETTVFSLTFLSQPTSLLNPSLFPGTHNSPADCSLCGFFVTDHGFRTCFLILCSKPSHDLHGAGVMEFQGSQTLKSYVSYVCGHIPTPHPHPEGGLWFHSQWGNSPDVMDSAF